MERKNIKNHTKENSVENFSKEKLENTKNANNMYLIEKDEKEIIILEKSCKILSTILKVECIATLAIITFAMIFNGFSTNSVAKVIKNQSRVSILVEENTKI